jgi:hypothetical protein
MSFVKNDLCPLSDALQWLYIDVSTEHVIGYGKLLRWLTQFEIQKYFVVYLTLCNEERLSLFANLKYMVFCS